MIQGIIFDCYGVLVSGSLDYLRSLIATDKQQALTDLSHAADRGFISRDDYVQEASELVGMTPREIQGVITRQEVRNTEMLRYVKSLKATYKTALLSNISRGAIERLFTPQELKELFDVVVLSSEVGITKPTAEIYRHTADRLGLEPKKCIMIDDIPSNIEGAKMTGMHGIVFESVVGCQEAVDALIEKEYA